MRTAEEFWAYVDKPQADKCWEWLGATNSSGYGSLMFAGKYATAHRVAAFLSGVVPSTSAPTDRTGSGFILHRCDNRRCCNPKHFNVGTYAQNQKEAYERKRRKASKGHRHTNAKLTAMQAKKIRDSYATGSKTQKELAAKFNVSQRVISLIVRNETYTE